jgi:hypothetical protein
MSKVAFELLLRTFVRIPSLSVRFVFYTNTEGMSCVVAVGVSLALGTFFPLETDLIGDFRLGTIAYALSFKFFSSFVKLALPTSLTFYVGYLVFLIE